MQNKVMLIIIIVLLVILIGAAAGFGFFFIKATQTAKEIEVEEKPPVIQQLSEEEITYINLSNPIRTNLATSADGSEHAISLNLSVGVNSTDKKASPALVVSLTEKEKIVGSIALGVIRKKTYQEIKRPDGKEILEDDILTLLQERFETNLIVSVEVSEMMTQ